MCEENNRKYEADLAAGKLTAEAHLSPGETAADIPDLPMLPPEGKLATTALLFKKSPEAQK